MAYIGIEIIVFEIADMNSRTLDAQFEPSLDWAKRVKIKVTEISA